MKKILTLICLLTIASQGYAQQEPQFTQFMQSGNILNPAFSGISRNADVKTGYRKQWMGLQGSPSTFFVSGSVMLGIDEPVLSLPVRGRLASRFKTEKAEYKDTALKHCAGAYLLLDRTGPTARNRAGFTYSANLPLKNGFRGSFGGGLVFSQSSLNRADLNVAPERDPNGIGAGISSKVRPDVQIGAMVYSDEMFFAYSANYLFHNKLYSLNDAGEIWAKQSVHHYAFAGYRYAVNPEWIFIPSLMLKYARGNVGMETNFRFNYGSKAWFGGAFRPQDSVSGFAGFYFKNNMTVAYSYDFNYSKLNSFNSGSHEIILGMRLVKPGEKLFKPGLW